MASMKYVCPACRKPVVSRRRSTCVECGAELPKDFLLSPETIAQLDEETTNMRARVERLKKENKSADSPPEGPNPSIDIP